MIYRYIVQTTDRKDDILLLTLAPEKQRSQLRFEPGQYATIGFTRGGRPTPMRCFSIVSTPASDVLQFAMRVRGNFTQVAAGLQPGDKAYVRGPFGDFTIDTEHDHSVVMLAGGIGITPFLSMIRDLTERRIALPVTLLFSNRSATSVPFKGQLQALVKQNPYLQTQFFSDDTSGKITTQHIHELTTVDRGNTIYFICGPKRFTESMQSTLNSEGIDDSRVICESFAQTASVTVGSGWPIRSLTYGLTTGALVLATGFIMALDLSRSVPRLASAQASIQTHHTTATSTDTGTSASNGDSSSSNNSGSTSTQMPATATSPTQNTQQTTTNYQPPISSVS